MTNHVNAEVGCRFIGDFVDEAEVTTDLPFGRSEAVRTRVIAEYVDGEEVSDGLREFTVLLKDGRVIAVRGHGLKHEPHPLAGQDVFSVVVRNQSEEVLVALFKSADVAGIFYGDMSAERKIA